ncbi:MAG: histidine phosphatase family protein [Candidatus Nanopelagicus sp.]|jgi:broad specificity phosphatase PhoE
MPIVYLLRHAQSVANTKGILAGQDDSVQLSKDGFKQSKELVNHLKTLKINQVYCSPLTRCIQTITPFMKVNPKIEFEIKSALIEMNYGQWSGKKLSALARDKRWKSVQNKPSSFVFPQGESFKQMRQRVDTLIEELKLKKGPILLVTHGDIIKMILAASLALPIDKFQSFVAEPASISAISIGKSSNSIIQSNFKIHNSDLNRFKTNALGGGNIIGSSIKWWKK